MLQFFDPFYMALSIIVVGYLFFSNVVVRQLQQMYATGLAQYARNLFISQRALNISIAAFDLYVKKSKN